MIGAVGFPDEQKFPKSILLSKQMKVTQVTALY